ncbi:hypothetical protein CYMTET_20273, partial [Cymbomonas tetramitiformis]
VTGAKTTNGQQLSSCTLLESTLAETELREEALFQQRLAEKLLEEGSAAKAASALDAAGEPLALLSSLMTQGIGHLAAEGFLSPRAVRTLQRESDRAVRDDTPTVPVSPSALQEDLLELGQPSQGLRPEQQLEEWIRLRRRFSQVWAAEHPVIGLVVDAGTGAVSLLQRHGMFSFIDEHQPATPREFDHLEEQMRLLNTANTIGSYVGGVVADAFDLCSVEGADPVQQLAPSCIRWMRSGGACLRGGRGQLDDQQRGQWEGFSATMRVGNVHLRADLEAWPREMDLAGVLTRLLHNLQWSNCPAGMEAGSSTLDLSAPALQGAAVTSLAQAARERLNLARHVLLLLVYMVEAKGQAGCTAEDALRLTALLPLAKEVYLGALLVRWLLSVAVHPDQLSVDGGGDGLARMHLSGRHECMRAASAPLALLWLARGDSPVLAAQGGEHGRHAVRVEHAGAVLRCGPPGQGAYGTPALVERLLDVATCLSKAVSKGGPQAHLRVALRLCQLAHPRATGSPCALLFLQGIYLIGLWHTEGSSVCAPETITSAFFRAATGLQQQEARLDGLVRGFMRQLRVEPPEGRLDWVDYFEFLMLFLVRYRLNAGARQFAYAALRHVDNAWDNSPQDAEAQDKRERHTSKLYQNIFQCSLRLNEYQEAYAALISDPKEDRQKDSLRYLINHLCIHNQGVMLCRLPYTGALLEAAESTLQQRAELAHPSATPNPYQILCAFHQYRSNHLKAAEAMLNYGERLGTESWEAGAQAPPPLQVLEEQASAYQAARASLSLVSAEHAWLPVYRRQSSAAMAFTLGEHLASQPGGAKLADAGGEEEAELGENTVERQGDEGAEGMQAGWVMLVAGLRQLENHCLLQSCWVALAKEGLRVQAAAEATVEQLLERGRYEQAVALTDAWMHGVQWAHTMQHVFKVMTAHCLRVQAGASLALRPHQQPGGSSAAGGLGELMPRAPDGAVVGGCGGWGSSGVAEAAWGQLRGYLQRHDSSATNFMLRLAVAEAVLTLEPRMALPLWLVQLFLGAATAQTVAGRGMAGGGGNPDALLRLYLRFRLLQEAAAVAIQQLQAWRRQTMDPRLRQRAMQTYFPHAVLDMVLEALVSRISSMEIQPADQSTPEGLHLRSLHTQLTQLIDEYHELAAKDQMVIDESSRKT